MVDLDHSLDLAAKRVFALVAALGTGASIMACGADPGMPMSSKPETMDGSAGAASMQTVPSMNAPSSAEGPPMAATPATQPVMPPTAPASQTPPASAPNPSTAAGGNSCPVELTTATNIVMDVSWPESLGLLPGTGKIYIWTKSTFSGSPDALTVVSKPCGTTLPELQTQEIAGGQKVLPEIPDATWDAPGMATVKGSAKRTGNMIEVQSGVALIGLELSDAMGAWPMSSEIKGFDHDGDGSPGITAVPRTSNGFAAPPTSILQDARTDKLYLAIRNIMTLSAEVEGCPMMYSGTAKVTAFDNRVIGCHVQGGAECAASEAEFVDSNNPAFKVAKAVFTTKVVPETATCADVRSVVSAGM